MGPTVTKTSVWKGFSMLFAEIERLELIRPGVGEKQVSEEIRDLAAERFGVTRHWHKRVVRAGENTLHPYRENPPDRQLAADDIVFLDSGPLFEEWEADFGRTFVLGDDPRKAALRDDLPRLFAAGRDAFETRPDMTGAGLFARVVDLSHEAGWEFGGSIAGHLVGECPHEVIKGNEVDSSAVANCTTGHSHRLGDQMPTRSPGPRPAASRPAARRLTWSANSR